MITELEGEGTTVAELLQRTPEGRAILAKLHGAADKYPDFLGKTWFSKLIKKIGKITSPITTRIAKIGAGLIGIPPSAIDKLAKIDPTAHAALTQQLAQTPAAQQAAAQLPALTTGGGIKPLYIGLAAGGAFLLVLGIIVMTKKRGR